MPSQSEKETLYLKRKIEREKLAREEAEHLLELKSLELYRANQQLTESIQNLDNTVAERTRELKFAREEAEAAAINVKDSFKRLELIIQASGATTWDWDIQNDIFHCADAIENLLAYNPLINSYQTFVRLLHAEDKEKVENAFAIHVTSDGDPIDLQCRFLHKNKGYRWFHLVGQLTTDTQSLHMVGSFADIHERIESDKIIEKMAHYDGLTEVANRSLFNQRFKETIQSSKKNKSRFALLMIDLNDFKIINDRYGHQTGDVLLANVASILQSHTKGYDLVARLGGDEFAIILNDLKLDSQLTSLCTKVFAACADPINIQGKQLSIDLSIGIAHYPQDGQTTERLLRSADMAMYAAKQNKLTGSSFSSFQKDFNVEHTRKRSLRDKIELALEKDEFHLEFQPCIEIATKTCQSCEALLRWPSKPKNATIQDVINVAEESGLILTLGATVIDLACRFIARMKSLGINHNVAINLSAIQFQHQDLVQLFHNGINKYKIDPKNIHIEVTENLFLGNMEGPVSILKQLGKLGMQIYIDDFGTGYSSLKYLQILPVDWLKIDKSFIDNIDYNNVNLQIIQAVIRMAHLMGKRVVAEGVETANQYELLNNIGCDVVQGYYISHSLTEDDYLDWLAEQETPILISRKS